MKFQEQQLVSSLIKLENSLTLLISIHTRAKKEYTALKEENIEIRERIKQKDQLIQIAKLDAQRLPQADSDIKLPIELTEDQTVLIDLRQKVNEYIKEIDYCISVIKFEGASS